MRGVNQHMQGLLFCPSFSLCKFAILIKINTSLKTSNSNQKNKMAHFTINGYARSVSGVSCWGGQLPPHPLSAHRVLLQETSQIPGDKQLADHMRTILDTNLYSVGMAALRCGGSNPLHHNTSNQRMLLIHLFILFFSSNTHWFVKRQLLYETSY